MDMVPALKELTVHYMAYEFSFEFKIIKKIKLEYFSTMNLKLKDFKW